MSKIGINGFGRLGRTLLRIINLQKCDENILEQPQVTMINDPTMSIEQMAYLFEHDTIHGKCDNLDVTPVGKSLKINNTFVECSHEKDPKCVPWKLGCCKYVVDCTFRFNTIDELMGHVKDPVKRAIVAAPSKDASLIVVGVNHDTFDPKMKVVGMSGASTNCVAPLLKVLTDHFSVEEVMVNIIQSVRAYQALHCRASSPEWNRGRAILNNLIPTTSSCINDLKHLFPDIELNGMATRTPISIGLMVDLTVKINKTCLNEIKCKFKEAAYNDGYMEGIIGYSTQPIVSGDVINSPYSVIFDDHSSIGGKFLIKLIGWCDNEWGYVMRLLDLIKFIQSRET